MKKLVLLLVLGVLVVPNALQAKSIAREGDPRLTFVDISFNVSQPIEQGTRFRLSATVIPTQNIWEDESIFLHIVSTDDPDRILINADFKPPYPTTRWAVGEAIKLGPVNLRAPEGFKPGKYKIKLGLFHRRDDGVYVREKYTNPEIEDWLVGDIEFYRGKRPAVILPDLVISDFSSDADLAKWQARGVTIGRKGKFGVIEYIASEAELIPSAILQDFFYYSDPRYSDWRRYDRLSYNIALDPDFRVTLQIKDKGGNRYQKDAVEEGGEGGVVHVNLIDVGKVVNIAEIGNLSFFTYKPKANFNMMLSDIKLIDTGEVALEGSFIEFKGLNVPKKARADSSIPLTAHFLLRRKFPRNDSIFVHFARKSDGAGYFTADTAPLTEATDWPVGKVIKEGPRQIYIPPETPPGIYTIEVGFFTVQRTGPDPSYVKTFTDKDGVIHEVQPTKEGLDYVRVPYLNPPAAGPWTVGEIEILPKSE